MRKPLYESIDERVWIILVALLILGVAVLSVIGIIYTTNNYVEEPNPLYDPYYYDKYEGRDYPEFWNEPYDRR